MTLVLIGLDMKRYEHIIFWVVGDPSLEVTQALGCFSLFLFNLGIVL